MDRMIYFGRLSRFTNESKFLDLEDRRSKTQKEVSDAVLKGESLRNELKGRRILPDLQLYNS